MKGVGIHALLAVVGLGLAYQTWTREDEVEERPPGEVEVLACTPDQLTKLEIDTPTSQVTVEPVQDGADRVYWITSQRKDPKKDAAKDAGVASEAQEASAPATEPGAGEAAGDAPAAPQAPDAGAPAEEEKKPAHRVRDPLAPIRLLASSKFDEYLKLVTPLRAIRGLGVIGEDRFEEFGFDDVGTYWRMECGGQKVAFDVGGRTFGAGNRYLRVPETGQVYLFEGKVVSDLQSAQYKFMQNELHNFELADADEARIAAQGAERHLLHRNRRVKGQARWVDAAEPDRRNELFGNWFQRVERLKVRTYLGPDEKPGSDLEGGEVSEPEHVMTISYAAEGKPLGEVEIDRVRSLDAEFFYAKSEATRGWVSLYDTAAKGVAIDIAIVAGADEMPETPETTGAPAPGPGGPAPASPHGAAPTPPQGDVPASPHGATPASAPPHGAAPAPASPHGAAPAPPRPVPAASPAGATPGHGGH